MLEETQPSEEPKRDWAKVLDLDRTTLIRSMVDRMERAMRDMDDARDDLKEIVSACRQAEFGPRDIEAMKKIAKLRKDDKGGAAKEQLEALDRIGTAVGFPLFNWAAQQAN